MARRAEKLLSSVAGPIADRLAQRYGSLKAVMSAGIISLEKLSPAERERMLDEANGLIPDDPSQQAAESARFCIKKLQSLDSKQYAIALQFLSEQETQAVRKMLDTLSPEGYDVKQKHKTKSA